MCRLHTHISETALEVENMRAENGMPVVPYVKKQSLFEAKVLAAHCVHIDEGEMRTLQHAGAGVAHNPSSNLKLASGVAPVKRMLEAGPERRASAPTARPPTTTWICSKRCAWRPSWPKEPAATRLPCPPGPRWMMATRLGAQALHLGHLTGSLEPGKRADLILVDITPLHNSPRFHRDPNGPMPRSSTPAKPPT